MPLIFLGGLAEYLGRIYAEVGAQALWYENAPERSASFPQDRAFLSFLVPPGGMDRNIVWDVLEVPDFPVGQHESPRLDRG